jgi:hypothetical protein
MGTNRIRPTLETRFHIDYDWWSRDERDLRVYLISHLPPEKQVLFSETEEGEKMDYVDPETGEVRQVDALDKELQEAAKSDDFITVQTSLVDAVFRLFIMNGNTPMTPAEIGEALNRAPQMILRTISGARVYKGIRPASD